MTRLIDTMSEDELVAYIKEISSDYCEMYYIRHDLEELFETEPHWTSKISPFAYQTYVLCFVSNDSLDDVSCPLWVKQAWRWEVHSEGPGKVWCYSCVDGSQWKYATPVDLSLRYTKGEK
jgi:hypothetical protein